MDAPDTVMTSRSYRFKPEIRVDGLMLASAEGKVTVRLDVTSTRILANTMPLTRSEGQLCTVTGLYLTYRSVRPGEWRVDLVIACGTREPAEPGDEDGPIRIAQWGEVGITRAPDWVRDIVQDTMPMERIGE